MQPRKSGRCGHGGEVKAWTGEGNRLGAANRRRVLASWHAAAHTYPQTYPSGRRTGGSGRADRRLSAGTVANVTRPGAPVGAIARRPRPDAACRFSWSGKQLDSAGGCYACPAMASELQQLEATIQGLESQRSLLGDALVDTALAPLRAKLATLAPPVHGDAPAPSLKQVTILFLDVVGSTTLSTAPRLRADRRGDGRRARALHRGRETTTAARC